MSAPSSSETRAPVIEERRDQRGGPGGLRAGVGVGGVEQGDGLVPGQARGGRGVVVDGGPGRLATGFAADVAAAGAPAVERGDCGQLARRGAVLHPGGLQVPGPHRRGGLVRLEQRNAVPGEPAGPLG